MTEQKPEEKSASAKDDASSGPPASDSSFSKDDGAEDEEGGRQGTARRGLMAIAMAKVWFILTGFAIKFSLPHLLGSPAEFGFYETAMSALSMLNMVLIASTIQTVSKFVSQSEGDAPALLRQGLRNQTVIGGVLAAGVFALAPQIARLLNDEALGAPLRVAAIVVASYSLYAAVVGSLNGRHHFGRQAALDATFSLLRSTGIIGGAALGFGALGAIGGFASAAVIILLVSLFLVRRDLWSGGGKGLPLRTWLAFLAPIWLYQAAVNGCMQIDGLVLKRVVAELLLAEGQSAADAATAASTQVGFYRAAQTFAFVPYQLILAITFIVFPMVSRATALGDEEAAQRAVAGAMRFSFLVLLALAAPIAGAAEGTLRIAYPESYVAPGAPALTVLAFAMVAFALFVIAATILSGAGRPSLAAMIAGVSVGVIVLGGSWLIRRAGPEAPLVALASGTALGTGLAFLLAAVALYLRFRTVIPWRSMVRGLLAAGVAAAGGHAMPQGGRVLGLAALVVGGLSYLMVLGLTGEIGRQELALIRGRTPKS